MSKRIPLPTDPEARKREQRRRHALSVLASQRRRIARLKVNAANLDLVGGLPPAIAKRVPLPKEPSACQIEKQFRNARRMAKRRAAEQRREASALPITPPARAAEINRRAQAKLEQFRQDNNIAGRRNLLDL